MFNLGSMPQKAFHFTLSKKLRKDFQLHNKTRSLLHRSIFGTKEEDYIAKHLKFSTLKFLMKPAPDFVSSKF